MQVNLTDELSVEALIKRLHLPQKEVHLVLVNGLYCPPDQRNQTLLHSEDVLAIWPPVAGG